MAKIVEGANVGGSKERSLLGIYESEKSNYSTQDGNQAIAGITVTGGFSDNTYTEKYAGGDGKPGAGSQIGHNELEIFERVKEQFGNPRYNG